MRHRLIARTLAMAALALAAGPALAAAHAPVTIQGHHFLRNGKPYQIISGSIHFQRVPRAYWKARLRMARAMGLNTITTYVFWNAIEPHPGHFDFNGRNDVAAFIRMAGKEGLNVILRPGPYVCAEWDAGGLPAWLFSDPGVKVRTRDPAFLKAVDAYFRQLGQQVAPLMAAHGGPVIAVQIENEYGAYGHDRTYLRDIQHALQRDGMGTNLMFTSDGPQFMANDMLKGVLAVVNFGPGNARKAFSKLAKLRPDEPMMAGEYWAGWYDKLGQPHAHTDGRQQARELSWMLRKGYSFNIYMFEGGTNFGFMNGANVVDDKGKAAHYVPLTTSYDYDAALDEAGHPTPKYHWFRQAIAHATHTTPPPVPAPPPMHTVPAFRLTQSASLWDNLPAPISVKRPGPMARYGEDEGYILYQKQITGPVKARLDLGRVRDYAVVYVDHHRQGAVDRRKHQTGLDIAVGKGRHTLDVLVENSGRVNYGPHLADGRSGLIDPVSLGGHVLDHWKVYPLPMNTPSAIHGWTTRPVRGPAFHRGAFTEAHPADTYWDMRAFHKGFAWVDGHNLGRIWDIGPQHTLYQPAPWLHPGGNTMVVFDLATRHMPRVAGVTHEIWSVKTPPAHSAH